MRRGLAVTALTVLMTLTLAAAALARDAVPVPVPPAPPVADGVVSSWIVTLEGGLDPRGVAPGLATQAGGHADRIFTHALHGFVFKGTAAQAQALAKRAGIRHVVADRPVKIAAETVPPGISRISADTPNAPDAHDQGFLGAGARVAVMDTGIDLTHPDLVAGIDANLGLNCMGPGPPQDGHGHGTHVAGIIAARAGNGIGVVGVAPAARLVPIKVLDDTGSGEWSNLICGIDYVTGLATDGDPSNNVDVVNMSLGDVGDIGNCSDGGVREAICKSVAAGIVYVAAAGNSATDTATFIPAAFPEVIAVSAMTDFDGQPGGLAGCQFLWTLLGSYCDDQLAAFTNYGSTVAVTAPGVNVYSTWKGGSYATESGTSMASPHVAGVVALMRAANKSLTPAQIESLLKLSGDLPDGSSAESGCGSSVQWGGDSDGIAEPLVNALRASQRAVNPAGSTLPVVTLTPADGATVSGVVSVSATATHPSGIASVQFLVDGTPLGTDTSAPYQVSWDTSSTFDGHHNLVARATAVSGQFSCQTSQLMVGAATQGDWVGTYGVDGYALGAWNGPGTSDLVVLPNATLTLEQGARYSWASPTSDTRALRNPSTTERRATSWYDLSSLRLRLDFSAPYSGTLHIYTYDWDSTGRRQTITVTDGTTSKSIPMTTIPYDGGAWLHFPINVPAGGSVHITADYVAGYSATIAGLFLGGAGTPPPPPPPPPTVPAQPTLTATAGVGKVNLSWTAPADGGSPITGYTLYRGTVSGSLSSYQTLGVVTAYSDTAVTPGTTYYYALAAANAIGPSPRSAERSATPPTVPTAPRNVTAQPHQTRGIVLSWTAPASTGGSAITGYRIYRATTSGAETLLTTVSASTVSYRDAANTRGVRYYYIIRAVNAVGVGAPSAEVSAIAR
jgi:subtilisin family serine protease